MNRSLSTLGAAVVVLAVAVATVRPAPAQSPKRGGVLHVSEQSDPVGFDTLGKKKAAVYTQLALAYTHNRLLKYDPSGEIVNDLAASWTQPNPTTYVVTLRKGVHFHNKPPVNGRELTSEDVKFTFERMTKSPEARLFPTLKAVTTPDKYTVRFELSAPFSSFVANLAATTLYIYAKEAGKPTSDGSGDYTAVDTVIGTGPFMLEEYREKQRLVFKRNPDYFESGKPYLDGVELYIISDNAGQIAAMRTGKLDLIPAGRGEGLPHFLVPEARSIPGAKVMPHRLSIRSRGTTCGYAGPSRWRSIAPGWRRRCSPRAPSSSRDRSRSPRSTSSRSTSSASPRRGIASTSPPRASSWPTPAIRTACPSSSPPRPATAPRTPRAPSC